MANPTGMSAISQGCERKTGIGLGRRISRRTTRLPTPSQETRPRSRRPERTCRYRTGRRYRALRTPWQSPRALCGTPGCRSFRMPRELDFHCLADQSLGCICGLHEDLGSTRISAAISVGRIEMEFPNDTDPVASHEVASDPFVEGAIELLHGIPPQFDCPVCRHKRSAASASGSRVPHLVRAPLRVLQSPLDAAARRPQAITLQQI